MKLQTANVPNVLGYVPYKILWAVSTGIEEYIDMKGTAKIGILKLEFPSQ